MMRVFYIPDGHRRYADREGCTLAHAYRVGYRVLVDEIIRPILEIPAVSELGIFLLSTLNLKRRLCDDLNSLLKEGDNLLASLIKECQAFANITSVGNYLSNNIKVISRTDKHLILVVGTQGIDKIDCAEVDIFLRSGGEMRLSGAPRCLIGDYTQFYTIDALHPDVRFSDIQQCFYNYERRYMRECVSAR